MAGIIHLLSSVIYVLSIFKTNKRHFLCVSNFTSTNISEYLESQFKLKCD